MGAHHECEPSPHRKEESHSPLALMRQHKDQAEDSRQGKQTELEVLTAA
jgi:hypothetical protein